MPGTSKSWTTTEEETRGPVERETNRAPTHPGRVVAMELTELELSVTEAARRLDVSRRTLSELVNARRAVSPEMALRLGRFFGTGPDLWLNMQTRYDLWRVQRDPESVAAAGRVRPLS